MGKKIFSFGVPGLVKLNLSFEMKHVSSGASFSCVRLLTLSECEFRHQIFIRNIPPRIDHEIFFSGNPQVFP